MYPASGYIIKNNKNISVLDLNIFVHKKRVYKAKLRFLNILLVPVITVLQWLFEFNCGFLTDRGKITLSLKVSQSLLRLYFTDYLKQIQPLY